MVYCELMLQNRELYQQAVDFRRQGSSYRTISTKLGIPKSTLFGWFSHLEWSQVIKDQLILERKSTAALQVEYMNRARLRLLQQKENEYRSEARRSYEELAKNPLFLIGLALYWGEGSKCTRGKVSIINSDPNVLKITTRFFREVLQVDETKLRVELFIYQDQSEVKIIDFWSKYLHIDTRLFIKTQLLPSRAKLTKRKVPYGMCSVYFSSTEFSIKIHEWLDMLAKF